MEYYEQEEEKENNTPLFLLNLSDGQVKARAIASLVSGTLSVIASSIIVRMVMRSREKTPYKRILLGLSLCDVVFSLTLAVRIFLLPSQTSQLIWAFGNDTTCSILGFFTQFGTSAIWYNGMLSYYFLFTVRFGIKNRMFARRIEPWMHILPIGFTFTTAAIAYAKHLYREHPLEPACVMHGYPKYHWLFLGIPFLLVLLSIVINNIVIFFYVRKTMIKGSKHMMKNDNSRRTKAVAARASLFVCSFFSSYICEFIIKVGTAYLHFQPSEANRLYPLLFLSALLVPLQGVFNLFIYTQPIYLANRKRFPEQSRLATLKSIWFHDTGASASVGATARVTVREERRRPPGRLSMRIQAFQEGGASLSNFFLSTQKSYRTMLLRAAWDDAADDVDVRVNLRDAAVNEYLSSRELASSFKRGCNDDTTAFHESTSNREFFTTTEEERGNLTTDIENQTTADLDLICVTTKTTANLEEEAMMPTIHELPIET